MLCLQKYLACTKSSDGGWLLRGDAKTYDRTMYMDAVVRASAPSICGLSFRPYCFAVSTRLAAGWARTRDVRGLAAHACCGDGGKPLLRYDMVMVNRCKTDQKRITLLNEFSGIF